MFPLLSKQKDQAIKLNFLSPDALNRKALQELLLYYLRERIDLFQFLDAYDFATNGTEGIEDRHEPKTLINASVFGLIFEKINGYKEGLFYTPAYSTMYMSRKTIRRAINPNIKIRQSYKKHGRDALHCDSATATPKTNLVRNQKIWHRLFADSKSVLRAMPV